MNSIVDYLEWWSEAEPDKRLFTFLDIHGRASQAYSYREFNRATRALASFLSRRVGLKHGERVLLVYPPGLDIPVAFLACARAGVIPVPACPPTSTGGAAAVAKLRSMASDCGPVAVLTTRQVIDAINPSDSRALRDLRIPWIPTDAIDANGPAVPDDSHSILLLQYTSGSTEEPKGVMVSHDNVIRNARSLLDHVPIGVSWLPQYHDMGLIGYYLFPIVTGGSTYGFSPADFLKRPALWLQTIARTRATYSSAPNFAFEYVLRPGKVAPAALDDVDLGSLRVLMNASEPVRADTYAAFLQRFAAYGLRADASVVAYGLAENTLAATHLGRRTISIDKAALARNWADYRADRNEGPDVVHLVSCGAPIDGVAVRIVDPATGFLLLDRQVGEIWIAGPSVALGYWNRAELTGEQFQNRISDDASGALYLRTGDLGFVDAGELFVCGRIKDLIKVRGTNHYPQDIEAAAQSADPMLKGAIALNGSDDDGPIVIVEGRSTPPVPDLPAIASNIRVRCGIEPAAVVLVHPHTIVRTTSGKLARQVTRQRFLNGTLPVISTFSRSRTLAVTADATLRLRFSYVYALGGSERETDTLADLGIDSLTLVQLVMDLEQLLRDSRVPESLLDILDATFVQRLTLRDFSRLLDGLESCAAEEMAAHLTSIRRLRSDGEREVQDRMAREAVLTDADTGRSNGVTEPVSNVFMSGATGFFGPFLLASLLEQTPFSYYVLTRARNQDEAMQRIRAGLQRSRLWTHTLAREVDTRVHAVCGDLALDNLGLPPDQWDWLTGNVQAVCHSAAMVNYVLNYDILSPHNVKGTRTLVRFATTSGPKEFHFISTTFIFGWTRKGLLQESDHNAEMAGLDFGYSQTKWVAEQLVRQAGQRGLDVFIYRPSLISASTNGVCDAGDIAVRLLAFMINNGVAIDSRNQISMLPADVAAHNIAAIVARHEGPERTFHVTAEEYYNMADLTRLITRDYGHQFAYFDIPDFVEKMNQRCRRKDPLYSLLDFFNRSSSKLAAMQLKRYDNVAYVDARRRSGAGRAHPSMAETVEYLMRFLLRHCLVERGGGEKRRSGSEPVASQRDR
jgi:thioester reductase-like protein